MVPDYLFDIFEFFLQVFIWLCHYNLSTIISLKRHFPQYINDRENRMDNPEKLRTQDTHDDDKHNIDKKKTKKPKKHNIDN